MVAHNLDRRLLGVCCLDGDRLAEAPLVQTPVFARRAKSLPELPLTTFSRRHGNRMAAAALRAKKKARPDGPFLERAAGIEPATLAWKARALPLCNARRNLGRAGFEPA